MWNFLFGFLLARGTRMSRFIRPVLVLLLIGSLIAGLIYAVVVFQAVNERNRSSYVHSHHIS
jgi:uncharacterized protein (DUF2062 family)